MPGSMTSVSSDDVLSSEFRSSWSASTEAVLVMVPMLVGTVTTISADTLCERSTVPRSQVTIPADSSQEPWPGVAETKVAPGRQVVGQRRSSGIERTEVEHVDGVGE